MDDSKSLFSKRNVKFLAWSISSGVIVAFFFASNILDFATGFSPGGEILFISPLFTGFVLGLLTTRDEVYHSVFMAIVMTITAVTLITLALFAPVIFGVSSGFLDLYYVFVVQNILISIVLIFPVSLGSAVIGKVFGEATLMGQIYKRERAVLRDETQEWYQMLEAAVDKEKKKLKAEKDKEEAQRMLDGRGSGEPPVEEAPPENL